MSVHSISKGNMTWACRAVKVRGGYSGVIKTTAKAKGRRRLFATSMVVFFDVIDAAETGEPRHRLVYGSEVERAFFLGTLSDLTTIVNKFGSGSKVHPWFAYYLNRPASVKGISSFSEAQYLLPISVLDLRPGANKLDEIREVLAVMREMLPRLMGKMVRIDQSMLSDRAWRSGLRGMLLLPAAIEYFARQNGSYVIGTYIDRREILHQVVKVADEFTGDDFVEAKPDQYPLFLTHAPHTKRPEFITDALEGRDGFRSAYLGTGEIIS